MKTSWSKNWAKSSQRRKQRKYREQAPAHARRKFLGAPLAKPLRKKHGMKTLPVRSGDKVKIVRGQYKGKEGKIDRVDTKKLKVFITGIERAKREGTNVLLPFHPSNVMIMELDDKDARRMKKTTGTKPAKAATA